MVSWRPYPRAIGQICRIWTALVLICFNSMPAPNGRYAREFTGVAPHLLIEIALSA
jgi:hypothetical protein